MKKPILLVPRNAAREMLPGPDTERLLASGSWLVASKPKPQTDDARRMDSWRERRKAEGCRQIYLRVPGSVYEAAKAVQRDGETLAQLFARLVSYAADKSKEQTDN